MLKKTKIKRRNTMEPRQAGFEPERSSTWEQSWSIYLNPKEDLTQCTEISLTEKHIYILTVLSTQTTLKSWTFPQYRASSALRIVFPIPQRDDKVAMLFPWMECKDAKAIDFFLFEMC